MDADTVARHYRRGVEAMEQQDWRLAAAMFRRCAEGNPGNSMYHQLARSCENKFNRNPGV